MRKTLLASAILLGASLPWQVNAATVSLTFAGPGVSGSLQLTYGPTSDGKYPQALEVTGISGTFSDSNNGLNIVNVPVGPLEPIRHDTPESTNLLAPLDFSRYAVASGLDPVANGFLTYDNLFYPAPAGSPPTASDYPFHGGILDIYGLMFDIGGGRVVDLWSNGTPSPTGGGGPADYGVAVATHATALDYVGGDVTVSPEPGALVLIGSGLLAMLAYRRRAFH